MSSLAALLVHLIDYAGLFPPASLSMKEAVEKYAGYAGSGHSWILGRFVLPAQRLDEFCMVAEPLKANLDWKLSALISTGLERDLEAIARVNETHNVRIDSVEMKVASAGEILHAAAKVASDVAIYFEIPVDTSPEELGELLAAVRKTKRRTKLRTGGVSPEAIPSSEKIVRFITACAREGVGFKATAGLHHPLRSANRLTYEPDSPVGVMHGFLNVFLASAWIQHGLDAEVAIELLEETQEANLTFDADEVRWRSRTLRIEKIISARKDFAFSFGSCSFEEPVEDLKALRLL